MIDGSLQEVGKPDETGDESSPCEVDDRIASDVIDGSLQEAGKPDETGDDRMMCLEQRHSSVL